MADNRTLGSIICPNCNKLISSQAEECMHCGLKNPNLWGLASVLRKLFGGQMSLVPIIATVCIVLYVLALLMDPRVIFQMSGIFGLFQPATLSLRKLGATGLVPIMTGLWWTPITAIYLHGNLLHIVFNVMWIRQLGPNVEELYGVSRSFVIYTVAGIVGYIFSYQAGTGLTLGASGAVFGLLGALIYYGRKRGGTFGMAIYKQTLQWAVLLFVIGFVMSGVDNFAHAGGFIGGYLTANVLGFIELKKENRRHHLLALMCIIMTVLAFLLQLYAIS